MTDRRPVLLTVSGTIPGDLDEQVAARRRPRADYRVLADHLDADVVDVAAALAASGRLGRGLYRLGGAGTLHSMTYAEYVFRCNKIATQLMLRGCWELSFLRASDKSN